MFRYKWILRSVGQDIVLSKSPILFNCPIECEASARRYKPSVDLTGGDEVCAIIESCTFRQGKILSPDRLSPGLLPSQLRNVAQVGSDLVAQLPYRVERGGRKLYIYCVLSKDVWFYSFSDDLIKAYHNYTHD